MKLHAALTQANIPYFIDYGTLLGFCRDQKFIPHDPDIDISIPPVGINPAHVLKCLLKNGFSFIHAFRHENKIIEFTVSYNKLPIDVFFYEKEANKMFSHGCFWENTRIYPNERMNSVRRYYFPLVENIKTVVLRGYEVCFPIDEIILLETLYGKSWKVPDPTWNDQDGHNWMLLESLAERVSQDDVLQA